MVYDCHRQTLVAAVVAAAAGADLPRHERIRLEEWAKSTGGPVAVGSFVQSSGPHCPLAATGLDRGGMSTSEWAFTRGFDRAMEATFGFDVTTLVVYDGR